MLLCAGKEAITWMIALRIEVRMPIVSSLVAPEVVIMTTYGTSSGSKCSRYDNLRCHGWRQRKLSIWQPTIPPQTMELTLWQLLVFTHSYFTETKSHHDTNFAVAGGGAGGCHNLLCRHWRQIWYHNNCDNFHFSMLTCVTPLHLLIELRLLC